mgnify:CR=1 FL=1
MTGTGVAVTHKEFLTGLPYGWIGVIAALHFGIWYYLGIEGTCQAAEEVRSCGRSLPLGTMTGMITLLHSCGNIREIVPDIVDLGFDVLHPLQPECMDLREAKRRWGDKLVFDGTVGAADNTVLKTFATYGSTERPNAAVYAAAIDSTNDGQLAKGRPPMFRA